MCIYDAKDNPNVSNPTISKQHMLTHFPKDPECEICNGCRTRRKDTRKTRADSEDVSHAWIEPKKFGDLLTADHKIIGERTASNSSKDNNRVALVIQDFYTRYIDAYPAPSRDADECRQALFLTLLLHVRGATGWHGAHVQL